MLRIDEGDYEFGITLLFLNELIKCMAVNYILVTLILIIITVLIDSGIPLDNMIFLSNAMGPSFL